MEPDLNSLIEVAQQIGAKQSRLMIQMREAFDRGDDGTGLALAKELVGLYDEPTKPESTG